MERCTLRITRTFQTDDMPTGDVGYVDETGQIWRIDYEPHYETTGVLKGRKVGDKIEVNL